MPSRIRNAAIALGVIAALSVAARAMEDGYKIDDPVERVPMERTPNEETSSDANKKERHQAGGRPAERATANSGIEPEHTSQGTAAETEDDQDTIRDLARADLEAQRQMADSTSELVFIGWWQFAAGAIGMAALFGTLWLTLLNTHANRAWITFVNFTVDHSQNVLVGDNNLGPGAAISAEWKNTGLSPALDCSLYIEHIPVAKGSDIPPFAFRKTGSSTAGYSMIGQGQNAYSALRFISQLHLDALARDELQVLVYATIVYRDIYTRRPRRQTEVCGEIVIEQIMVDPANAPRFAFVPRGKQNRAI